MKKITIRLFALLLVVLMVVPVLFACGEETKETEKETETKAPEATVDPGATEAPTESETESVDLGHETDDMGYIVDNLPDNLNYRGEEFLILAWEDVEHPEFGIENPDPSNIVDVALYNRIQLVNTRLNVDIQFAYTPGNSSNYQNFNEKLQIEIEGDQAYDAIAAYSFTTASAAANGRLYDLLSDECAMLDFDMPWWSERLINEASIKNHLYFASGDISNNVINMMYVCYANKSLLEQYNLENPQNLVESGDWTYDVFFQYCDGVYSDVNGDGEKNIGDQFGYMSYTIHFDPWFYGTGATMITKDADGNVIANPDFGGEKVFDTLRKITNLCFNTNDGIVGSSKGKHQTEFRDGRLLFCTDRARVSFKILNANEDLSYYVLPCPKYDKDGDYVTCMGNPFTLYGLPAYVGVQGTAQMGAAVLEALASESYRSLTPAVYEISYKLKYFEDETSSKLFDIIKSKVTYDLGRLCCKELGEQDHWRSACTKNGYASFTSVVNGYLEVLSYKLPAFQKAMTGEDYPLQ